VKTEEQWTEAGTVFNNVRSNHMIQGKPFLVIANKQDNVEAQSIDTVCQMMKFDTNRMNNIIGCSAFQKQDSSSEDHIVDKRLEMGLEWLLTVVNSDYEDLNTRVLADTKKKTIDEAKRRLQRERKVLKNKIASVYLNEIPVEHLPPDTEKASADDVYDEGEGLKFLADEIGQEVDKLPEDAKLTARLVGYQRLALQMIGALNCPISKKKTPMPWEDIKHMILDLHHELGLNLIAHTEIGA